MDDDMLLKIANIAKVAWTARDVNQPVWRRLGGFAKESIPWSKGFTPGLTQKLEGNVISKLTDKPMLQDKYTKLLANRATKSYSGNNISRGIGSEPYTGLGKSRIEVDPNRALKGIHKGNHVIFRQARDWNKANGIEVEVKNADYDRRISTQTLSNRDTNDVVMRRLNIPLRKKKNLNDEFNRNITVRHEINELDLDKTTDAKVLGYYPSGEPVSARKGIGTHTSMGVLGREQITLRDAPDEVYNKHVNDRTTYQYADWKKLDKLKEIHGVSVKPYGEDLRYRPKEVKQVDAAAYKSILSNKQRDLKYSNFISGIDSKYHDKLPTKMRKPMKAALRRGDDDALEAMDLRDNGALGRISKVRDYLVSRANKDFNPRW